MSKGGEKHRHIVITPIGKAFLEIERLKARIERLEGSLREVAIPSLKYCEDKYGHDDQARLNLEACLES